VVIAHRLNTIQNADEIYFVNQGHVQAAGSMEQALALLKAGRPAS
jgi:ATP-binding cassette subfamily B protein